MGDTPNTATPEQNAPTAGLPPTEAGAPGATDIELQNPFRPQGPLDLASAIGRATTGSVPLPSAQGPQGQLSPEEQQRVAYDTRRLKAGQGKTAQPVAFDPNAPYQSVTKAGESLMFDPKAPYESVTIGGKAAPKAPPTPTEPQGPLDVLWDKVNKAIIPKEAIFGAMTGYTTEELQKALKADPGQPGPQVNIPGVGAFDLNTLATGTLESIAGTASQFTSPLSIGLLALGPLAGAAGKSAQALRLAKLAKAADGEVETYEIIQAGRTADLARATEQVGTLRDEAQAARAAVDAGTGTEEAAVTAENKLSEAIKNLTSSQEVTKEIGESLALKRVAAAQANRISIQALDVAKKVGVFGKIPEKAAPALQWLQKGAMFGIEAQMVPEIIKGQQDGESFDQMVERRLNALGWAMLGAEGLKGSPLDVPLKDVPNLFVKGAGKVADAAGSVRELVSSVAAKVKNPNMTLGDALKATLGKTADFDTAMLRGSKYTAKQAEGLKASMKTAHEDVQAVFNAHPDIDSPKDAANALRRDNSEEEQKMMQASGLTRDTKEAVVPDAQKILEDRIDKFFADNKGRFSAEDAEKAKKDILDHFMQREKEGVDEKGKPIYTYRAPNLFEAENVRVGLNDLVRPQYNTNAQPTTNAFKAAAFDAVAGIRDMIDKSYDAHRVEGVKEFRAKEKAKIDIADALDAAQPIAEQQGEPGVWKSLVSKYGATATVLSTALSIGMHNPYTLAAILPYLVEEQVRGNLTNKTTNIRRAVELAARNPNARATGVTVRPELAEPGTTPPNAEGQVGPPMAPPPAAPAAPEAFEPPSREFSPLHSKLASYLRKRVGDISYEEAEKDFLKAYDDHVQNNVPPEKMKREQVLFEQIQDVDAADALAKKKFEAKAAEEAAKAAEKAAAAPKPKPAALPEGTTHVLTPEGKIEPVRPKGQAPSSSKEAGAQEQVPVTEPIQKTPQHILSEGYTDESLHSHEYGHAAAAAIEGIRATDFASHLHDSSVKEGLAGSVGWQEDPYIKDPDAETKYTRRELADNMMRWLRTYMGGAAANNALYDLPLDLSGDALHKDVVDARNLMKAYGIAGTDAEVLTRQAFKQTRNNFLTIPGVLDTISMNSSVREAGLRTDLHASEERMASFQNQIKELADEEQNAAINRRNDKTSRETLARNKGVVQGVGKERSGQGSRSAAIEGEVANGQSESRVGQRNSTISTERVGEAYARGERGNQGQGGGTNQGYERRGREGEGEINPLNAETRAPFEKTEPHQQFPEDWADYFATFGMSPEQVAYHEAAHHYGHARTGFESGGTIGQEHPEAKRVGGIARADWNQSQFRNEETGEINSEAVHSRIGDLLYNLYMGPVADELRFGIKMENNKGGSQDFKNVEALLDIASRHIEIPKADRAALKDAAIARAKEDLTHPGIHEILSKYTSAREAGIPKEMLMTPETVQDMQTELLEKRGQNGKTTEKALGVNEPTAAGLRGRGGEAVARGKGEGVGAIARGAVPAAAAQARTKAIESPLTQNLSYEAMKGMKEARESENLPINVKKDVLENPLTQRLAELKTGAEKENPLNAEVNAKSLAKDMIDEAKGIGGEPTKFQLADHDGRVELKSIETPEGERGKGHASQVLSQLTKLADKHGVQLELNANPFETGEGRLGYDELKSFYKKHGFEEKFAPGTEDVAKDTDYDPEYGYMVREPKGVNPLNAEVRAKREEGYTPEQEKFTAQVNSKYKLVGDEVDGRAVREHVPNFDSINASLGVYPGAYDVLDGVREVPMSEFSDPGSKSPRITSLANQIKESKELSPLIVGVDGEGAYIIEGVHRFDALRQLGARSFPAVVAVDLTKEGMGKNPLNAEVRAEQPVKEDKSLKSGLDILAGKK